MVPDGSGGVALYHIHTDHLNTPRRITDPLSNTIVWRWDSEPFGATLANEDPDGDSVGFVFNHRFPGQYFDGESGFHYNYHRTYDPSTGRYLESDPIGLNGGLNTYGYGGGNPLTFFDPYGLRALSQAEKAFLQAYFGKCLDVDKIDLKKRLFGKRAWSPGGNKIRLPKSYFADGNQDNDVRLDDPHIASIFAHEAAHVWQRQNGVAVTRRAIGLQIGDFFGNSPYDYDRSITDPTALKDVFDNGNVERQGRNTCAVGD